VSHFRKRRLPCIECHDPLPFDGLEPLSPVFCAHCGAKHMVPLHLDGYWLFAPLGAGGMGAVYKAYHRDTGEALFAVKILPRAERANPLFIGHLRHEAEVCRRLTGHPCLVRFVASSESQGEHYLVTEFVGGGRLDKHIEARGKLPINEVMFVGLRLIAAEAHIYNQGFLYRDLKPGNVLMASDDGPVLCDYGICVPLKEAYTCRGDFFEGTPVYLPPERVLGEGEQVCSEIYSLGMLLFHAATGHSYVNPRITFEELKQLVLSRRNAPRKGLELKEIPSDELAELIGRMIEVQPYDRYQAFAEVERDLLKALHYRFQHNQYGRLTGI
jgi:serine/threonine protein kinase